MRVLVITLLAMPASLLAAYFIQVAILSGASSPRPTPSSEHPIRSGASWYAPRLSEFRRYFRRADSALQELDLVVLAAGAKSYREDHGAWPTTPTALVEAGLVTQAEQQRTAAARLVPASNGDLDLGLKLVRPSDEAPERIVTVHIAL